MTSFRLDAGLASSTRFRRHAAWGLHTQHAAVVPHGAVAPGRRASACCHAKSKDALRRSFDSEDELDRDLATELAALADPQRAQKQARHFDLAWKIARPGRPQACDCCKGRKEEECNWCNGTGYLMVGSQIFPSTPTHNNCCPVCKGTGYTQCERCRGTGFRAAWLPADSPSELMP